MLLRILIFLVLGTLAIFSPTTVFANLAPTNAYPSPLATDVEMPCLNKKSLTTQDIENPKTVTLPGIKAVPGLYDNLNSFFGTKELEGDATFLYKLKGSRIDPSKCWSIFEPVIDIASCRASKPAGENRLRLHKGEFQIFVDTDEENVKIPVPITSICSDGKNFLRFRFLYYKVFKGLVTAGPWETTVEVHKNRTETIAFTNARPLGSGEVTSLNVGKISVASSLVTDANGKKNSGLVPLTARARSTIGGGTTASQ